MNGKAVIFSAPSGSGKSTIVNHLLQLNLGLEFSISATTRQPRGNEKNGIEYFFFSVDEFKQKIEAGDFVEWQEVYSGCFYGTLKSEVERIWNDNKIVIFDVDVEGGVNLKKIFGDAAMSMFIQPPSVAVLRERLINRGTDTMEKIEQRVGKAEYELTFANKFDCVVVNDVLENAFSDSEKAIRCFVNK